MAEIGETDTVTLELGGGLLELELPPPPHPAAIETASKIQRVFARDDLLSKFQLTEKGILFNLFSRREFSLKNLPERCSQAKLWDAPFGTIRPSPTLVELGIEAESTVLVARAAE